MKRMVIIFFLVLLQLKFGKHQIHVVVVRNPVGDHVFFVGHQIHVESTFEAESIAMEEAIHIAIDRE